MADTDIGYGTDFQRGTGSGPIVYATVGEVIDIKLPELTRDTKDATHYKSPDRYKEYIGALRDGGEAGFTLQFKDAADLTALLTDYQTDAAVPYRIVFPDATHWTFSGLVTKVGATVPLEDRMTAEVTVKISGKPAFLA